MVSDFSAPMTRPQTTNRGYEDPTLSCRVGGLPGPGFDGNFPIAPEAMPQGCRLGLGLTPLGLGHW